jgi:hypothetical protein
MERVGGRVLEGRDMVRCEDSLSEFRFDISDTGVRGHNLLSPKAVVAGPHVVFLHRSGYPGVEIDRFGVLEVRLVLTAHFTGQVAHLEHILKNFWCERGLLMVGRVFRLSYG